MKDVDIAKMVQDNFADLACEWVEPENGDSYLFVPGDKIQDVAQFLKETWDLSFDYLMSVSAFDTPDHIEVTYHFHSYKHGHTIVIKVKTPRENGEVNTIVDLYGAANFQEREVFDHFGVKFKGHPDLRRILLPDDWVGFPLLKDYKEQEEYNGMGTTRPPLL